MQHAFERFWRGSGRWILSYRCELRGGCSAPLTRQLGVRFRRLWRRKRRDPAIRRCRRRMGAVRRADPWPQTGSLQLRVRTQSLKKWCRTEPSNSPVCKQQFLKPTGGPAGAGVVAAEFLEELFVAVDDPIAAFDACFGRITLAPLTGGFECTRAVRRSGRARDV
jgi:hypothetical protein